VLQSPYCGSGQDYIPPPIAYTPAPQAMYPSNGGTPVFYPAGTMAAGVWTGITSSILTAVSAFFQSSFYYNEHIIKWHSNQSNRSQKY